MRIVHVSDFVSEYTGYQDFLLPKYHAKHGHEVHIVTSNWNPPAPNYEASMQPFLGPRLMQARNYTVDDVTLHRLKVLLHFKDRLILKGLESKLREIEPDIIFVHNPMTPTAIRVSRISPKLQAILYMDNHSIYSVRNASFLGNTMYATHRFIMRKYMASRTHGFFGVAPECVDFMIEMQGAPQGQVELLPLGVDAELFRPSPEDGIRWRNHHGIPGDAIVVTQTGKLDTYKDPLTLARSVKYLRKERSARLFLVFAGSGTRDYQEKLINESSKAHGVTTLITGPVPVKELAGVFSGSNVVCFPGGTSMSSIEAAACGTLVVMNDEPVSLWRSGLGIGQTFPEGDCVALAEVIDGLLTLTAEDMKVRGETSRKAALSAFGYEDISRNLENRMEHDLQLYKSGKAKR